MIFLTKSHGSLEVGGKGQQTPRGGSTVLHSQLLSHPATFGRQYNCLLWLQQSNAFLPTSARLGPPNNKLRLTPFLYSYLGFINLMQSQLMPADYSLNTPESRDGYHLFTWDSRTWIALCLLHRLLIVPSVCEPVVGRFASNCPDGSCVCLPVLCS